jgi:hypothetical protein
VGGPAIFAYSTNYLVDLKAGVIKSVHVTSRRGCAESCQCGGKSDQSPSISLFFILLSQANAKSGFINPQEN